HWARRSALPQRVWLQRVGSDRTRPRMATRTAGRLPNRLRAAGLPVAGHAVRVVFMAVYRVAQPLGAKRWVPDRLYFSVVALAVSGSMARQTLRSLHELEESMISAAGVSRNACSISAFTRARRGSHPTRHRTKARRRRLASAAQPRAGLDGEHCRVPWE